MPTQPLPPFGIRQRSPLTEAGTTPADPAYWNTRLLRQRYTVDARPGSENELFARIEHDGQWLYFPLEGEVPEKASVRASEIYRALLNDGWQAVRQRHVRQIVWAIYWFTEPLAGTYATLFTVIDQKIVPVKVPRPASQPVPVALVESETEVLAGLTQCLNQMPGFTCVQTAATARELLQQPASSARRPRLVLFNQQSLDLAAASFQQQLQLRWPGVVGIPFDIFGHSDELFMSVTGMDRGYFLRRRPPTQLLEPLAPFWQMEKAAGGPVEPLLRSYFQKLVVIGSKTDAVGVLSQREIEILRSLGAGHTDKTIAKLFGISIWTVHTHIKTIFKKLGVHTRAEAIMRYLQK